MAFLILFLYFGILVTFLNFGGRYVEMEIKVSCKIQLEMSLVNLGIETMEGQIKLLSHLIKCVIKSVKKRYFPVWKI